MVEVDEYTDDDWKRMEKEIRSLGGEILPIDPQFAAKVRNMKCKGYIIPKMVVAAWKHMINFNAKEDDIIVDTFYKAGTTWMQQIVYLIYNDPDGNKNLNYLIDECFPFIEFGLKEFNLVENMKSPRFIKSHLPYELLPQSMKDKKCKIIYVARNPKDVIVSSYFFIRKLKYFQFKGTLEEHAENLITDIGLFCPFWRHVLGFWDRRNDENILFIKYEDMQKDLKSIVKQVAEFAKKPLTEKQIESVTERCKFNSMSKDPSVNRKNWTSNDATLDGFTFMRKGETGDWKNHLSEALCEKIDEWTNKNTQGTDFIFDYGI